LVLIAEEALYAMSIYLVVETIKSY
jgi:hypothetical protein